MVNKGNWQFTHFRPGNEPFHALAQALLPLFEPDLNSIEQFKQSRQLAKSFIEGSVPLKDVFGKIERNFLNERERVLLIADQFEELYTLCSEEKPRNHFLDFLLDCFQSSPSILDSAPVMLTTMRADFFGHALAYSPLAKVFKGDIKLGAMNREQLSLVITKPADSLGVEFEPGLVNRILDDVEKSPGNLALLEFALTELWQEQKNKKFTHQAYKDIGQVKGALADYAEKVYKKLSETEREQARQIFIQLANFEEEESNNTRRIVNRKQIGEDNWELVTRRNGLAKSRLVITSLDSNNQETLEIVHEALISHWKRLR